MIPHIMSDFEEFNVETKHSIFQLLLQKLCKASDWLMHIKSDDILVGEDILTSTYPATCIINQYKNSKHGPIISIYILICSKWWYFSKT